MAGHKPYKETIFPGGDGTGCSHPICLTEWWKATLEILRIPDDVYLIVEERIGDCCDYIWEPRKDNCGETIRMSATCNRRLCIHWGDWRLVMIDCNTGEKIVPDDDEILVRMCAERTQ